MKKLKKISDTKKVVIIVWIIALMAVVYYLSYISGGIHSHFSHLMYLPIIISAFFFKIKGGMISALFTALLLGPFMPVTLTLTDNQEIIYWLIRLSMFIIVGLLAGKLLTYSNYLKRKYHLNNK